MNPPETIQLDTFELHVHQFLPWHLSPLQSSRFSLVGLAHSREATETAAAGVLRGGFATSPVHHRTRVLLDFLNARRQREGELPLVEEDITVIATAAKNLLQLAVNPLGSSLDDMESFAYAGTIVEGEASSPAEWIRSDGSVGVPEPTDHWHLYIRELAFEGEEEIDLFGSILLQYAESFPARAPWSKLLLEDVVVQRNQGAQRLSLKYVGVSVATSVIGRILDDLNDGQHRHFVNFASVSRQARQALSIAPAHWHVYQFVDAIECETLQLRARPDLLCAERAAVACILEHSLNSAPGGFYSLRLETQLLSLHPSSVLVENGNVDPIPHHLRQRLRQHWTSMRDFWRRVPGSGPSTGDTPFEAAVRESQNVRWVNGGALTVVLGKDITVEGFNAVNADLAGFWAPLAGPGPKAALLHRTAALRGRAGAGLVELWTTDWVTLVGDLLTFGALSSSTASSSSRSSLSLDTSASSDRGVSALSALRCATSSYRSHWLW